MHQIRRDKIFQLAIKYKRLLIGKIHNLLKYKYVFQYTLSLDVKRKTFQKNDLILPTDEYLKLLPVYLSRQICIPLA